MDKLLLMLQLQLQLNDATNGPKWREGVTKTGNTINWKRCIYMECAEMVDSFSWKHWKDLNQAPDWDNLQIEVVDVWHFIISLGLEEYFKQMKGELEDLALALEALPNFSVLYNKNIHYGTQNEVIEKVENIMLLVLQKGGFEIEEIVAEFFDLVRLSALDLDTLYRLYVGKNILNQFRQDHGYKEGTYIKEWDGQEDNVVMKRLWEEDADMKPEILYKKMAKIYLPLSTR